MGIWRSIFGWKALFRWDVLGAVVPGIFLAIGIGMLGVDWFPRNLLISQISFAIGALLCLLKFVGHAIESNDARGHRVVFAVVMCGLVVLIATGFIWGIQKHKNSERPVLAKTAEPIERPTEQPKPSQGPVPQIPRRDHTEKSKPQSPATPDPIILSATIVNPHSPGIAIENRSNRVAEGITWEAVLYRETDLAFLSFASQTIGYVKPHSKGPNYGMNLLTLPKFTDGDPQIRNGDPLIGSVCVDCPECKGVTYIVHFVWGDSGWTYEVPNLNARLAVAKDNSQEGKRLWVKTLNDIVPQSERTPIE